MCSSVLREEYRLKGLKYTEKWICRFADCNLYFNIKGRKYTKQLIPQLQEIFAQSMFQQDCAPLHFHTEVGMIPLLFFLNRAWRFYELTSEIAWSDPKGFFIGFCEDNI
jgi:hypothetical protein